MPYLESQPIGVFSCRSFLKALEDIPRARPSSSLVWLGLAPPRLEAFCWLVVLAKVSMVDNSSEERVYVGVIFKILCSLQEGEGGT